MTTPDFTTTILVSQTPQQALHAITNFKEWWSAEIEGDTDKLNGGFIYHYKDIHYCKLKLVELVADEKLVYLVLDNYFKFTKDKSEWKNTKLVFELSQKNDKTAIKFTHEGLVPQYECYEICREAWTDYIQNSLYSFIATGKGQPNSKEDDSINARLAEKWSQETALA